MTVGELVYKQAVEAGYDPERAEGFVSPLNEALESYRKMSAEIYDQLQEPMRKATEAASTMAEAIRPQMEMISKIRIPALPTIPSYLLNEDGEYALPEFTRPVQEVRIVNPEVFAVPAPHPTNEYVITKFTLPPNATWESLDIQFIDGHFVRVSYPNMKSRKFDFKDMGFINTKTNRPDRKWELLKEMADNSGALTNEKWDRRFSRNVKYELNERLKGFFGMKDNPIPHYTKRNGYHAKFTLRGDR